MYAIFVNAIVRLLDLLSWFKYDTITRIKKIIKQTIIRTPKKKKADVYQTEGSNRQDVDEMEGSDEALEDEEEDWDVLPPIEGPRPRIPWKPKYPRPTSDDVLSKTTDLPDDTTFQERNSTIESRTEEKRLSQRNHQQDTAVQKGGGSKLANIDSEGGGPAKSEDEKENDQAPPPHGESVSGMQCFFLRLSERCRHNLYRPICP